MHESTVANRNVSMESIHDMGNGKNGTWVESRKRRIRKNATTGIPMYMGAASSIIVGYLTVSSVTRYANII